MLTPEQAAKLTSLIQKMTNARDIYHDYWAKGLNVTAPACYQDIFRAKQGAEDDLKLYIDKIAAKTVASGPVLWPQGEYRSDTHGNQGTRTFTPTGEKK